MRVTLDSLPLIEIWDFWNLQGSGTIVWADSLVLGSDQYHYILKCSSNNPVPCFHVFWYSVSIELSIVPWLFIFCSPFFFLQLLSLSLVSHLYSQSIGSVVARIIVIRCCS